MAPYVLRERQQHAACGAERRGEREAAPFVG